ncbi:hypothetical protein CkaCkLH20_02177 [Colletotrichum karsti]|uniref:Uncharacterized protein n=1 Tax=Colletotrichum karsti TaxID=1095194 RepID=A0A9P6IAP0_9PEZI|nr:uncharacterized protein CkaCkLH20_02177 [Colletotrichum karsti]KAF9880223.1 hypothetical protein CkaCkLH20_02177 [Colletotrichum karsti]
MQSPMRGGPQLHNPQNTLRGASPANPATPVQGRIDNGRMGAPLPGLDEQSELQLPAPDIPPVSTADATTSLGPGTTSSSTPAPSADETGILGRLRRRRMASKDKDTDNNKKRWMSTGGDRTKSQPVGADDHTNTNSSDPVRNIDETNDAEMQAQSLLLPASHASQKKLNDKTKTEDGQPVSDTRNQSSSSVPRFLRQVVRPQQATSPTQTAGAVTPPESKPRSQSHSQTQSKQHMAASTPSAQPKVRTKPSFGKRFWSKSGANDFGDDDTKTDAPVAAPVVRPIYVPKHAAADFSRTTHPARHQRQSISIATGDDSIRPLATISTQAIEDELQYREQRMRTLSAEKEAEKRKSRDMSSSKYGAPSPQELHRRLEIVKSSEIEVVTTREPGVLDAWAQLHGEPNISSANGKGLARSHSQSRPRSSQRHSFNLVADPYARDLTPPKSVSPVEMEAPFDPPSQSSRQTPEQSPQPASQQTPEKPKAYKPTHAAHSSRPRYQPEEKPRKDMSDFERFIADAEDADRDYHAQMWRNLARRSGHYGYADNTFGSFRPDPVSLNPGVMMNTQQSSKRDSAYYSTNKRASVLSAPGEDELKRQASISKRFSDYIKPPKPSGDAAKDDWMVTGRANRRSIIAGVAEE